MQAMSDNTNQNRDRRERLLDAALAHVPFDGWSEATLAAAAKDLEIPIEEARALFPRGGVSLAAAYHERGDEALRRWFESADLSGMRYSEKVGELVWQRIRLAGDREVVRAATTLFALPQNAAEGARLIWHTADLIWRLLGDTSRDYNWYTKRAILSGVYGASVLYWLGDTSADFSETRAFIARRIANVMQFEKFKGAVRANPVLSRLLSVPADLLRKARAPGAEGQGGLPGRWEEPPIRPQARPDEHQGEEAPIAEAPPPVRPVPPGEDADPRSPVRPSDGPPDAQDAAAQMPQEGEGGK